MITAQQLDSISVSHNEDAIDAIDATRISEPDLAWVAVDAMGHVHHYNQDGLVPTLTRVADSEGCDEDGESYSLSHYECERCGERIEPGVKATRDARWIRGFKETTIDITTRDPVAIAEIIEAHLEQKALRVAATESLVYEVAVLACGHTTAQFYATVFVISRMA
jgi:hypothetical protein